MILLDGKATAAALRQELKEKIKTGSHLAGRKPGLTVILVGDDPASQIYVRNKQRACLEVGIHSEIIRLKAETEQDKLENIIAELNNDSAVDGILLQLPLPFDLDSQRCLYKILPQKDVDGFHPENMGRLTLGLPGLRPCTPSGIMFLLEKYNLSPAGKKSVVIGRSNIVGRPLSLMLSQPGKFANSTVTVCHSGTPDLKAECLQADFLFLAMGRAEFLKADMLKPGAVIIDIGINRYGDKLCGDCDFEAAKEKAMAITPVPGGIGPMTIAMLLANTYQAFCNSLVAEKTAEK